MFIRQVEGGGQDTEEALAACFVTVATEFNRLARLAMRLESQLRFVDSGFTGRTAKDNSSGITCFFDATEFFIRIFP